MKQCSQDFIQELQSLGRQVDCIVTYAANNELVTLHDELYSVSPSYHGNILKSVMKEVDIESSVEIPKETIIKVQIGLLVDDEYEYLDFGNYVVYESEEQIDEGTYRLKCYDKMIYAMKDYEALNVTWPVSLGSALGSVCSAIGLSLKNTNFKNKTRQITSEVFENQGLTYRDVLDQFAQAVGGTIVINKDDEVEVRYINETGTFVTEHMLKDTNVNVGQKYGPVNSIVLSRGNADNVYLRDEESVAENGLCEIKIVDNQIMNFDNRADYLPDLLMALGGLTYYTNDYTSTGLLIYDVCDAYNISITGQQEWQRCIMFNDEITIDNGIEENIYTELPEEAETDYTKADKTDQRINKTYFIVDKQNQTIQSVVTSVGEQNDKISEIEQTVDEINAKISDVIDLTETKESLSGALQFEDVNTSEPVTVNIRSTGEYITYLYPWASDKTPANNLYIKLRTLRFINTKTSEIFDWELPDDLLYYNENVYDELLIDYETQTSQILKRCRRTGKSTVEPLGTTQIINIPYPSIELTDGDYTVQMLKYDGEPYPCYIKVRVMKQNIYTTQFYTKAEVNSMIHQTELDITLSVDEKLTNYVTETQMNAAIAITAQSITSTVSRINNQVNANTQEISVIDQRADSIEISVSGKVDNTEYTNAKITAKLNDGTSLVQISADKISLTGKTLDCSVDNISIVTPTMQINRYGARFYNEGTEFGFIGSTQYSQDHSQKGVSFDLNPNGRYMDWASRTDTSGDYYSKLFYCREYSFGTTAEGIYLGTDFYTRNFRLYIGLDTGYHSWMSTISNTSPYINVDGISQGTQIFGITYYGDWKFSVYNDGDVQIDGNVYANNISSDGRLKKNIEESTTNALDIIKQIKHRQFDWKKDDKHISIGYIAQEVEQISSELIMKRDIEDSDGKVVDQEYYMNELPLIATATKAIQEQQAIIEDLQNTILQQNELLDIIKEKLEIEVEQKETKSIRKAGRKKTIIQYDNEIIKPRAKETTPKLVKKQQTKNGIELVEVEE